MALMEEFWPLELPSELNSENVIVAKQDMIDAGFTKLLDQNRQQAIVLAGLYPFDLLGKCHDEFMKTVVAGSINEATPKQFDYDIYDTIPEVSLSRSGYAGRHQLFSKIVVRTLKRLSPEGEKTEYIIVGLHEDSTRKYEFVIARWGDNMPEMDNLATYNVLYEQFLQDQKDAVEREATEARERADVAKRKQRRRQAVQNSRPYVLLGLLVIVMVVAVALTGTWLLLVLVPLVAAVVSMAPLGRLGQRTHSYR